MKRTTKETTAKKKVCFQPLGKKIKEDVKFCDINDYYVPNLFENIDEEAMGIARRTSRYDDDGTFREMLTYEGHFDLFEFVKFEFVYEFLEDTLRKVKLLKRAIENEVPDEIILEGNRDAFEKIVSSVAESNGVSVRELLKGGSLEDIQKKSKNSFKILTRNFLRQIRRSKRRYFGKLRILIDKKMTGTGKKILFVLYSRNHVNTTLPIIKELRASGKEVRIIGLNVGRDQKKFQTLKEEKQPFSNLERYITRDISSRVKKTRNDFLKKWELLKKDPHFKEQLSYDGISLWEVAKDKFEYFFRTHFADITMYIEVMKQICDDEKPDMIITSDTGLIPVGASAVRVGNLKGIPTLAVQQGFHPDISLLETISPEEEPFPPKRITAYGDFTKRVFEKRGCNPEKIVVTGDTRLDDLARAGEQYSREKVCNLLNIDQKKRIIVLATNPIGNEDNKALLECVFVAMKDIPNAQLVVKPHPSENENFHRRIARHMSIDNVIINKQINLQALLFACDALLCVHSTVALEAIRLKKPVISINLTNIVDRMDYAGNGVALGVCKKEDIPKAIISVLEDEKVKEGLIENGSNYAFDHLYKNDGKATKRVVEVIEAMI